MMKIKNMRKNIYRFILRISSQPGREYVLRFLKHFLKLAKRPRLTKLMLHITDNCNYNCRYCYVDKRIKPLGIDQWVHIIDQAKSLGVKRIGLLGGEPLLSDHFETLLERIKSLNLDAYIYTNGSNLTTEWIEKLKSYDPLLIFKYDLNDEVYKYHTQQNDFSLSDLDKKISECHRKGLRVMTFTTLLKSNHEGIDGIFKRSLALGALPAFERYAPVGEAGANEPLDISDEQFSAAMQKVEMNFKGLFEEWLSFMRLTGDGCACYKHSLSVLSSGKVLPCPYLPQEFSIGDIKMSTLAEILQVLQEKKIKEYKLPLRCSTCKDSDSCGGGCRTRAFIKKRDPLQCNKQTFAGHCSFLFLDLYENIEQIKEKLA